MRLRLELVGAWWSRIAAQRRRQMPQSKRRLCFPARRRSQRLQQLPLISSNWSELNHFQQYPSQMFQCSDASVNTRTNQINRNSCLEIYLEGWRGCGCKEGVGAGRRRVCGGGTLSPEALSNDSGWAGIADTTASFLSHYHFRSDLDCNVDWGSAFPPSLSTLIGWPIDYQSHIHFLRAKNASIPMKW